MPRHLFPSAAALIALPLARDLAAQAGVPSAVPCARRAAYVVAAGSDTIGAGWTALTDSSFESQVRAVAQGALLRLDGRGARDGLVTQMRVRIWHAVADSAAAPTQDGEVRFTPAEVVATVTSASRGTQVQRVVVPPGSMPYMANVPLFLELLAGRVRAGDSAAASVPVYWLFSGEPADTVAVEGRTAGGAVLRFPGQRFALRLGPGGELLEANTESLRNATARRVRTVRVAGPACRQGFPPGGA